MKKSKTNIQKKFKIEKKWIIIGLLIWISSFFINTWPIIIISIFCVANAILTSMDRYMSAPIDLELSNFSSIIISSIFGLKYGLLTAFLTKFADMMYNKRIKISYFFMISSYMVAAFFAHKFSSMNVVTLGIIVTLLSNTYLGLIRKFVTQYSIFEVFIYGGSNVIFNIVMFIGFSQPVYNIIKYLGGN